MGEPGPERVGTRSGGMLSGPRTYVGFGLGAIQAGLFLYEAFRSGNFGRLVVAEIVPELVAEVRRAGGFLSVNIAHADRIEAVRVGPVEVLAPAVEPDRRRLVEAIAEAEEIGTAVPSVAHYRGHGPTDLAHVLAQGLRLKAERAGPRAVLYAAENHNHAAEILTDLVLGDVSLTQRDAVRTGSRFLNTVVGKMSGLVADPREHGLATITPDSPRAYLVESFNRILISKIRFPKPFQRGITVFQEKDDLLPFEEAKLFGHNATHALAAYVGRLLGVRRIAELADVPGFMPLVRDAFLAESGESLIRKHGGVDALFTPEGYREYADDLLARMTNPYLMDTVERVGRDPERKLGWDDRLMGVMRLALAQGVEPKRYALGAAAGLVALDERFLEGGITAEDLSARVWKSQTSADERREILTRIEEARRFLADWRDAGFPELDRFFRQHA